eukprot:6688886-Prymnesium_polylepis.1
MIQNNRHDAGTAVHDMISVQGPPHRQARFQTLLSRINGLATECRLDAAFMNMNWSTYRYRAQHGVDPYKPDPTFPVVL